VTGDVSDPPLPARFVYRHSKRTSQRSTPPTGIGPPSISILYSGRGQPL